MVSDDDIKKLSKVFATKKELGDEIKKLRRDIVENVATKQDLRDLKDELSDKMSDTEGRITNMLEGVVGDLKEIRQEQLTHAQRHTDLESIPIIAQQLRKRVS